LLLLSIYNRIDPLTVITSLRLNNIHWIIWWVFFISGPIVGFGLLYVTKLGWYSFVVHGLLIMINNLYYFIYAIIIKHFHLSTIATLVFLIGGFALLYIFLKREIRSPFFNPATRWWDMEGEAKIEMDCLVTFTDQSIDGKIFDISKIGCFLKMEPVYNVNEEVLLEIDIEHKLRNKLYGKIVWVARDLKNIPDGIGIKFYKKTQDEKDFINKINLMLKELKKKMNIKKV
jgi:Tfp pilus assembly protein PilZ